MNNNLNNTLNNNLNNNNNDLQQLRLLTSQWLVYLIDQIIQTHSNFKNNNNKNYNNNNNTNNKINYSSNIPPIFSLSKLAKSKFTKLCETLEIDRIALICLQEMTRISSYQPELKGIPALKLAGLLFYVIFILFYYFNFIIFL